MVPAFASEVKSTAKRYRRSPFCLLEWDGPALRALNCETFRMFRGAERYVRILHELSAWTTAGELANQLAIGDEADADRLLQRLVGMSLVIEDLGDGEAPPSVSVERAGWDLVDLAVQRGSAHGGYDPAALDGPPPATFKDPPGSTPLELPSPPLDATRSLASVLEDRRSSRSYATTDVSAAQLGTFLSACGRVTRTFDDPVLGGTSRRPYPSGGARHPLEIYPVCNSVDDIGRGAYWYDPKAHLLYPVASSDDRLNALNREVRWAAGGIPNRDPPVILVITAVFGRTMWKYRRIGLSLILKDLGGLYQTMHLVATAMRLAGCPLGAGNESENARWLGLDPLVESQVGAFLLGARVLNDPAGGNLESDSP